jgi:hypothetical protein
MRKYPCRQEITEQLLESKMKDIFGKTVKRENHYISSYSESLEVIAEITGKKEISVETKSTPGTDQEMIVKLYNKFLEDVTGYNAKERKKMVSKG